MNSPTNKDHTLMSIPKLASFDRTVRFSEKTKEKFQYNSFGPVRRVMPVKNSNRDVSPYDKWREKHESPIKIQTGREMDVMN